MVERDQFQIIQEILRRAIAVADSGWLEMIIDYYVDDSQSVTLKSFLIEERGAIVERPLETVPDMDFWLRELRAHLSQSGKPRFTRCKLHVVSSTGKYEATYGYEDLDWDALLDPDWNFFPTKGK